MDIELLKDLGTIKKVDAGGVICREGDLGNEMYIILAGKIDVFIHSPDNRLIKVSQLKSGEFFGEMSLLENQPRSATVVAVESTLLLALDSTGLQKFISRQPAIAYKMMKGLSSRIRQLNDEISRLKKGEPGNTIMPPDQPGSSNLQSSKDSSTAALDAPGKWKELLFPPQHKSYPQTLVTEDPGLLFEKQVTCPLCRKVFTVNTPRYSKLKLEKTEPDFRRRYAGIEPLWYTIWTCPDCLYSSIYSDFESSVPLKVQKAIQEKTKLLDLPPSLKTNQATTFDQVFFSYYLALYCENAYNPKPLKSGKLWLQLSWLYEDASDAEMVDMATSQALENYYKAYYNSSLNLSTEESQQCCLLLGELYLKKGDEKEALRHLFSAINRRTGTPLLNKQAEDRLEYVKSKQKNG